MIEMIQAYLDQTPTLIAEIKSSLQQKNWKSIETGVHKMLPSFSIVGIDVYYEKLARRLKDMAQEEMDLIEIPDLVVQLEQLCTQACHELEADLIQIKNNKNGKR
jgi:HPt (histidine-containing phosphotransfer) domain-containing protein